MGNVPSIDDIYLAREVRGLGEADRRFRDEVQLGKLVRLHRGAFVEKEVLDLQSPLMRYHLHCLGAFHASRTDVVLSHDSAAAMHGIPILGRYPKLIHVLVTMQAGTRTEHGYRKHATWHPRAHLEERGTLVLTDLPRTLVEFACTSTLASAVTALDWALRNHGEGSRTPITKEALIRCADDLEIRRGRKQLAIALELANPLSESPGESLSRVMIHQLGFPKPILQQAFSDHGGPIGRVDFWWPDFSLIGEFDGVAKYVREEYSRGKSAAQIVVEEKIREDRLRATGPRMTRWGWEIATTPQRLFVHLREAGLPSWRRSAYREELRANSAQPGVRARP